MYKGFIFYCIYIYTYLTTWKTGTGRERIVWLQKKVASICRIDKKRWKVLISKSDKISVIAKGAKISFVVNPVYKSMPKREIFG